MVWELQIRKTRSSNAETEGYKGSIVFAFEKAMNNDLDLKTAFNGLYETLRGLHMMRDSLTAKDIKNINDDLHRVDSVLQFIF